MKISNETIKILTSFLSVNQSIYIESGSMIKSVAISGAKMATAHIEEDFPEDFGIYDLNSFLNLIDQFHDPDLSFHGTYLVVKDSLNESQAKLIYAEKKFIKTSDVKISLPDEDVYVNFNLLKEELRQVTKVSSILNLDYIKFNTEDGKIRMSVVDQHNEIKNSYTTIVGETDSKEEFSVLLKTENILMLGGDYDTTIGKIKNGDNIVPVIIFKHKEYDLEYFVALDMTSKV